MHQHQVQQQNKTNLEKSASHLLLNDSFGNSGNISGLGINGLGGNIINGLQTVLPTNEINTNCHSLTNGVSNNVIDTSGNTTVKYCSK